jgi:integrase
MERVNKQNNRLGGLKSGTFAEFIAGQWEVYLASRKHPLAPSTLRGYRSMLKKHLLPTFGHLQMVAIGPLEIDRFLSSPKVGGKTYLHTVLRTIFKAAKKYGVVAESPMREVEKPEYEAPEKPVVDSQIVISIIREVGPYYGLLLMLAWLTSARVGELRGLQWQDWDANTRRLQIRRGCDRTGVLKAPKTARSIRSFILPPGMATMLNRHRAESAFSTVPDFIFVRPDGRPPSDVFLRRNILYPAMDRLGIKRGKRTHGYHLFRHSSISALYAKSLDIKLAQEQAGHATMSQTADVYAHIDPEVRTVATDQLWQAICDPSVTQESQMVS